MCSDGVSSFSADTLELSNPVIRNAYLTAESGEKTLVSDDAGLSYRTMAPPHHHTCFRQKKTVAETAAVYGYSPSVKTAAECPMPLCVTIPVKSPLRFYRTAVHIAIARIRITRFERTAVGSVVGIARRRYCTSRCGPWYHFRDYMKQLPEVP